MCIEHLTQLGLTSKEARLYVMLHRIGPSMASSLAQRVSLNRVTTYTVLDALCRKGLVIFRENEKGRTYISQDPEALFHPLEEEKMSLQNKWQVAELCVKKLQKPIHVSAEKKKFTLYQGKERILKALHAEYSTERPLFIVWASQEEAASECLLSYLESRERPTPVRILLTRQIKQRPLKVYCRVKEIQELSSKGILFAQNEQIGFLTQVDGVPELMQVNDFQYANFIHELLIQPHWHTVL